MRNMKITKENVDKMRAAIDIFDSEIENLKILENLYEFISSHRGKTLTITDNYRSVFINIPSDVAIQLENEISGKITFKKQELGL